MSVMPQFCQSCSMPMVDESVHGVNADRSKNDEYCCYCYQDGKFTADITLDDMIATCVPHMVEAHPAMTAAEAETMLRQQLPKLKRWHNA